MKNTPLIKYLKGRITDLKRMLCENPNPYIKGQLDALQSILDLIRLGVD